MKLSNKEQIVILDQDTHFPRFSEKIKEHSYFPLKALSIEILQVNVGKLCNLSCKHCHVEAGPKRKEIMPKEIFEKCLDIAQSPKITTIDITGGAPEMNPHLKWFIEEISKINKRLIVRSNLVVLLEKEYEYFTELFANHKVEIVVSLPDFHPDKTNRMRGKDVFEKSVAVLKKLNDFGYGKKDTGLNLNLVHNAVGAYLPAAQDDLESEYKKALFDLYKVEFNQLFCLANMPIGRYLEYLLKTDNFKDYMDLLIDSYNPGAVENVMCRTTLSVAWDGTLYDCDFNQMLEIPIHDKYPKHINDFSMEQLDNRDIMLLNHCYGCTAGSGSSCQGKISE